MKTAALFFASLFLAAMPAVADTYVESNFTFTSKVIANVNGAVNGVRNYITVSLKNADILAKYSSESGANLTKKAKIICRDRYNSIGSHISHLILIRDGATEIDITSLFDFSDPHEDLEVFKHKYASNGTGTLTGFLVRDIDFEIPAVGGTHYIYMHGWEKVTRRVVLSKEETLAHLNTISYAFHGESRFYILSRDERVRGLLQGTLKLSGPKIVPEPLE